MTLWFTLSYSSPFLKYFVFRMTFFIDFSFSLESTWWKKMPAEKYKKCYNILRLSIPNEVFWKWGLPMWFDRLSTSVIRNYHWHDQKEPVSHQNLLHILINLLTWMQFHRMYYYLTKGAYYQLNTKFLIFNSCKLRFFLMFRLWMSS